MVDVRVDGCGAADGPAAIDKRVAWRLEALADVLDDPVCRPFFPALKYSCGRVTIPIPETIFS